MRTPSLDTLLRICDAPQVDLADVLHQAQRASRVEQDKGEKRRGAQALHTPVTENHSEITTLHIAQKRTFIEAKEQACPTNQSTSPAGDTTTVFA